MKFEGNNELSSEDIYYAIIREMSGFRRKQWNTIKYIINGKIQDYTEKDFQFIYTTAPDIQRAFETIQKVIDEIFKKK